MTRHEQLIAWLNDAQAMEVSNKETLERHLKDAREFPHLEAGLHRHILETQHQAHLVRDCIEQLGGGVSSAKNVLGNVMGKAQGLATAMFSDELLKNCLMDYALEHFEIACYRSLVIAAEDVGEARIAQTCREILQQEEAFADWLAGQIPPVTRNFLRRGSLSDRPVAS